MIASRDIRRNGQFVRSRVAGPVGRTRKRRKAARDHHPHVAGAHGLLVLRRRLRHRARHRARTRRTAYGPEGVRGQGAPRERGRLCTKGATTADMLAAPGRLATALVRDADDRGAEPVPAPVDARDRGDRAAAARHRRRARAGRRRPLRLRADVPGGPVPGEQAGQGLHRHEPDRVELAAVHGERGHRLQAVARRRRAARLVPGLRPGRRSSSSSAPTWPTATRSCSCG